MWVDGGIHANEWIGHAVASFIARLKGLKTKKKANNGVLFKRSLQCTLLFSPLVLSFNCSELVENDEAHPDLSEELDWFVLQTNIK